MSDFECPACGVTLHVSGEKEKKKKRGWLERLSASGSRCYDQRTRQYFQTQPVAQAPPWQQAPQQQAPGGSLGPGETVWRRLDLDDVRVPLLLGLAGFAPPVVAVTLGIGSWYLWEPLLWWLALPFGAILIGADIVFWVMVWPHIRHKDDEKLLVIRKSAAEPAAAAPEPDPEPKKSNRQVNVVVSDGKGHDKRALLPDTSEMHNLAQAILNGDPFTEKTAKRFGFSRQGWEAVRDLFVDRAWAVWHNPSNHKEGLGVIAAGRAALRGCLPHSGEVDD